MPKGKILMGKKTPVKMQKAKPATKSPKAPNRPQLGKRIGGK